MVVLDSDSEGGEIDMTSHVEAYQTQSLPYPTVEKIITSPASLCKSVHSPHMANSERRLNSTPHDSFFEDECLPDDVLASIAMPEAAEGARQGHPSVNETSFSLSETAESSSGATIHPTFCDSYSCAQSTSTSNIHCIEIGSDDNSLSPGEVGDDQSTTPRYNILFLPLNVNRSRVELPPGLPNKKFKVSRAL